MTRFNQFCRLFLVIHLLLLMLCATGSSYTCTLNDFKQSRLYDDGFDLMLLSQTYEGGATVRVRCKTGFRGFFKMTCSSDGWTTSNEKCKPIACGHPGDVQFADFTLVRGTDYVFGTQVQYTCHKGYQITSLTSTRSCLEEGWDGQLPVCERVSLSNCTVEAFQQSHLYNVNFDVTTLAKSYGIGDTVRVPCQVGFTGSFILICDSDGQWFHHGEICEVNSCGHPGDAQFADFTLVHGADFVFGSQVQYTCHKGYQMTSLTSTRTCLQGGWEGPLPVCERVPLPSCTLKSFKQSDLFDENFDLTSLKQSYDNGDTVRVPCYVGFSGFFILICDTDGQWTRYGDICKMTYCGHPGDAQFAEFALVEGTEYVFGSRVQYSCRKGYQMISSRRDRSCLQGGWDGELPICKPLSG